MSKAVWIVAAVALVTFVPRLDAQKIKREPITPIEKVDGASTFKAYCAQCHGTTAKGDGPAAPALKVPPPDLTLIAKKNGGKFPAGKVKQVITEEVTMPAHGSRDMPMWGHVFRSVENSSVSELRVVNLVRYLEEIQAK
jgi:mono/diheme cytochrome c family protein